MQVSCFPMIKSMLELTEDKSYSTVVVSLAPIMMLGGTVCVALSLGTCSTAAMQLAISFLLLQVEFLTSDIFYC